MQCRLGGRGALLPRKEQWEQSELNIQLLNDTKLLFSKIFFKRISHPYNGT